MTDTPLFPKSLKFKILTLALPLGLAGATPTMAAASPAGLSDTEPRHVLVLEADYPEFKERLSTYLNRPAPALSLAAAKSCQQKYADFFSKPVLNFDVYWGYANTEQGITDDVYQKKAFLETISERCLPGLTLCEFKKVADGDAQIGSEILERELVNPFGKPVRIRITLSNASLTPYQAKNEDTLWQQQYYRSLAIEKAYLRSLQTADAVFYVGHARYGTGIGFRPFATGSLPWVRSWVLKPMKFTVEKTLQQATSPAKVLGFVACDSDSHYGRALHAANPLPALLLTRNATAFRDVQTTLFASVNALISGQCEEQMQMSLRIATRTYYYFAKDPAPTDLMSLSPKLFNFFEDDTAELAKRKPLRDGLREELQMRSIYQP